MIDLALILERIERRLAELGTTAAEVSAQATDSKDTIRNWVRAIEADRRNGTSKASATTIKLNQVESVLGIELARNAPDHAKSAEAHLRSALIAYGVDRRDLKSAMRAIKGFVSDDAGDEPPPQDQPHDLSEFANHRRVKAP